MLIIALLPFGLYVLDRNFEQHRRHLAILVLSIGGALGGLLTSSVTSEQVSVHRSLVSAHFLVLGCAVIALELSPILKTLTTACAVVGAVFGLSFLHDYFDEYRTRSRQRFQDDIRAAGEVAQLTGDFASFYDRFRNSLGLTACCRKRVIFYEAARSGQGCPGFRS